MTEFTRATNKEGSRKEKTAVLDGFCSGCGHNRKHAVRLLRAYRRYARPRPKKKGRAPRYDGPAILKPLAHIWLAANLSFSKRLKAVLPLWLPFYEKPLPEHVRSLPCPPRPWTGSSRRSGKPEAKESFFPVSYF